MSRLTTAVERMRNTPGLGRDVTAMIVCLALATACGAYILSHQAFQAPWTKTFTFRAEFDKAPAVRPQSLQEVRIAGVQVGRITGAAPTDHGTAMVDLSIDPQQTVYENARVLLRTKSPLNVMYVTLDPGGPPARPLPAGGTIPLAQTSRIVQPNEILDKLDARARFGLTSLLNELDVATARNPQALGTGLTDTAAAMRSFQPVLAELRTRRQNLARLVTSFSQIARAAGDDDERLVDLVASSQEALDALASRDTQVARTIRSLPGFTTRLRGSMASVDELTGELDPTLDDLSRASGTLPKALGDLTGTVTAIRQFVSGAAPVVDRAGPVTADLEPFVGDARASVRSLRPQAALLPQATRRIVPWMEDLAAFVYQTSSAFSLFDANGGMGRANVNLDLTNPSGGLQGEGITSKGTR
ncbi:MlaD family protein [Nocardioides sp. TRM66260-LWL]|uniref:MlaD family protein n=1 Tax=Nocardioides sp. TRM66260-LWL TaxID=2874478 RepID=UPI001CC5CD9F|nr:MlaD family protein [Nocardioides sp. TRM66260-LWL]MBZ5735308.1 MlaD family protein [Nocardioides sp. TRM66260-LWL]